MQSIEHSWVTLRQMYPEAPKLFPHHLGIRGNCPVHLELNYPTTTPTSLSGMSDQEEHDNDG